MNPEGDYIPPPWNELKLCICGKKGNEGKGSSIACGARAKRKELSSVATFPNFHPTRRFFIGRRHPIVGVVFLNFSCWWLHGSEKGAFEGLLLE